MAGRIEGEVVDRHEAVLLWQTLLQVRFHAGDFHDAFIAPVDEAQRNRARHVAVDKEVREFCALKNAILDGNKRAVFGEELRIFRRTIGGSVGDILVGDFAR